jgi:phosphatidylethanolamine-binding protein (PEBP) family uncharacterized protein
MSIPRCSILLVLSCAFSAASCAHALDQAFSLTSADLSDQGTLGAAQVLDGFGCQGSNQSPQLSWTDPPAGDKPHRYVFTVHALKVDKLPVPPAPSGAMVGFMLHANALGSARMTALYGR